jgi:TRAP-type C4-dicarboxylate transport system substrate-binding protein
MNRKSAITLAALLALTIGSQAVAQEKKTMKYAHFFAASHWHWTDSAKVFTEEVTRASGGRITFEPYHAAQLGKEGSTILTSGLADMALIVPSYEPARVPLTSVAELPGFHKSSCDGTAKLWHVAKDGGPLNTAEYQPKGFKVLYTLMTTGFQVMTSKKQVTKMEDLAGLKIRANGAAMDKTVRLLGATPVRVTASEVFDALSRGTVDGAFWPIGSTSVIGLQKVFRYTAEGGMLGGGSNVYAMSQKAWDALSAADKDIFTKAGAKAQQHACKYLDDLDASETKMLVKDHGLVVTQLPPAEFDRWNKQISSVGDEWAKEMDSTGRPGAALLKAYKEAPTKF